MATKFYTDAQGNYLGGFDGAPPPQGAIEVTVPPDDGHAKFDGTKWIPPVLTTDQKIKLEYFKDKFTTDVLVEALWQAFVEGDHTLVDQIQAKRDAAKK